MFIMEALSIMMVTFMVQITLQSLQEIGFVLIGIPVNYNMSMTGMEKVQ